MAEVVHIPFENVDTTPTDSPLLFDESLSTSPSSSSCRSLVIDSAPPSSAPKSDFRGSAPVTHTAKARLFAERSMSRVSRTTSSVHTAHSDAVAVAVEDETGTVRVARMSSAAASGAGSGAGGPDATRPASYLVGKLQAVTVREPAVAALVPYGGVEDWAARLVVVVQNPIRREVRDLYYMLSSMSKRQYFLGRSEFDQLAQWFGLFAHSVAAFHRAMERATQGLCPGDKNPFILPRELVAEVKEVADYICEEPAVKAPGNVFVGLVPRVDSLCQALMDFFARQLRHPAIVRATNLSVEAVTEMERNFAMALRKEAKSHFLIQLAIRWSEDSAFRAKLRGGYLYKGKLWYYGWRREYQRARQPFVVEHVKIVDDFFRRWNEFEKEHLRA